MVKRCIFRYSNSTTIWHYNFNSACFTNFIKNIIAPDYDEIESTVNSINALVGKPENAVVWGDEWNHVLQSTLGIIDGSKEAKSIR